MIALLATPSCPLPSSSSYDSFRAAPSREPRRPHVVGVAYGRRRFAFFQSLANTLESGGRLTIVDVGGSAYFWSTIPFDVRANWRVVVINLSLDPSPPPPGVQQVVGSGLMLPFMDHSVEVVFSNSVIEHLGDRESQHRMAAEIRRVGRRYFVQTPNRYFPIQPHFLVPCFQFLPPPFRAFLLTHFDLGWIKKTGDYKRARARIDEIRLISCRELQTLFPHAAIYRERTLGLVKSLVAYGGW